MRRQRYYQLTFGLFLLSLFFMARNLDNSLLFCGSWLCALLFSYLSFYLRQIRCPHCGRSIHQYWQHFLRCPYCGEALEEKNR